MKCIRNGEDYCSITPYKCEYDLMIEKKILIEQEKKHERTDREKKLYDLSYDNWISDLSNIEMSKLTGMDISKSKGSGYLRLLKSHFDRDVWPMKRLESN